MCGPVTMPRMNSIIGRTELGRGNSPLALPKTSASKTVSTKPSKSHVDAVTMVARVMMLEIRILYAAVVGVLTVVNNPQPQLVNRENLDRQALLSNCFRGQAVSVLRLLPG